MFEAAIFITAILVETEPVNVMCRISGWLARGAPASFPVPVTTLNVPSGSPALESISPNKSVVREVVSAGFATTLHPAARAGAIPRAAVERGKFQGIICNVMPAGSASVKPR